jgi:hypothetical protein
MVVLPIVGEEPMDIKVNEEEWIALSDEDKR